MVLALEPILRTGEVRHICLYAAGTQGARLSAVERVAGPDQGGLIGVDDPAAAVPDLDPDHGIGKQAGANGVVHSPDRRRLTGEQLGGDVGGGDAVAGQLRQRLGVADRLGRAAAAQQLDGDERQEAEAGESGDGKTRDGAGDRGLVPAPTPALPGRLPGARRDSYARQQFRQVGLLQQGRGGPGGDRVSHQLPRSRQCYDGGGLPPAINRRVASTPEIPGIARSMTTTCGRSWALSRSASSPLRRRADQPQAGRTPQRGLERAPEARMVVGHEHGYLTSGVTNPIDLDRVDPVVAFGRSRRAFGDGTRTGFLHTVSTISGSLGALNWTFVLRLGGRFVPDSTADARRS